jgi:F0F1-type ATP synthase assembly protein I
MKSRLERFVGSTPKPLQLAAAGFGIAAVGAVLAFTIDYGPHNPWSLLALCFVILGVGVGFVAVLWGQVTAVRSMTRGSAAVKANEGDNAP